jgi:septal ring factor EnvC (AmiA/AmiB activator)
MNSMSEMHAEIAERDRQRHVTETGDATIEDELRLLERQVESLKDQVVRTRQRLRQESPHTSAP